MFTAYDVCKDCSALSDDTTAYKFGFKKEKLVAELRALADRIEKDEVAFQKLHHTTLAKLDDFVVTRVSMTYHEKAPVNVKYLYSADQFPVAVGKVEVK